MSREVYEFAVTIPAGTAQSAGFSFALTMPPRIVTQIDIRVPPGPNGVMSFGIGAAGSTILPHGGPSYFTMSDQYREFPLEQAISSGSWALYGYNTGVFDHTVYVTFHCELPYDDGTTGPAGGVPISQLGSGSGSPTGAGTGGNGGTGLPPVVAPPTVTPPTLSGPGLTGPPLVLPPTLPPLPGQAGPVIPPEVNELLIGAGTSGTVWLLDESGYSQVADQDSLNALVSAGIGAVQVADATHQALLSAAYHTVTMSLGDHLITGHLLPSRPPVMGG